ncbi:cartilage intermediate layer protein 1 isoform X1 [Lagopus muta]|uniref:cartilage intermediate layer protein 1 isoform X1 n=2 Tax=Lagopus muta TaxID=64668 RepID=UPI0020A07A21|nr:cartilage intermediate layer protein 1 isoform X1 [Lagopus muta]XP_048811881.1 cartilage intermediate layer protein 1 isoform X1 [Lagopus muta]XP_048811882.1 cartilage intermediate layer protein 1 isoform X1 [Lagopus muta]
MMLVTARGWMLLLLLLLGATASSGQRLVRQGLGRIQIGQKTFRPIVMLSLEGTRSSPRRLDPIFTSARRTVLVQDPRKFLSPWSKWSECSGTCGQTGVQKRTRSCLADRLWGVHCNEVMEEGRLCIGHVCSGCNITCPMGRVNADCDACMCEDVTLHGKVSLEDGSPADNARVYLQANNLKLLTTADNKGTFRIPGVCPDGSNTLKIKKAKYTTAAITVPETNRKNLALQVQLKRSGKPYVFKSPDDKARRVGQSVSLCCNAVGTPAPDRYLWYHNGSLLDPSIYRYKNNLILKNLNRGQAGEYFCKAISDGGSAKSQPATLSVIGKQEAACSSQPQSHLIRLPHDCFQKATDSFYYDVGKCPARTCVGKLDKGLRCKDNISYCCGVSKMEVREILCDGYTLPTKVAVECGCKKCTETKITVRGRATAVDNGEPLRFGHIYMGNKRVSMTGYKGTFSIHVPPDTERLVLTFVDRLQKFVNTTKVLPFKENGGAVFHDIKLLRKKAPVTLESTETSVIPLGEKEDEDPIAELEIPPDSFYRKNGEPYRGKVKASVTFLDPRELSTAPVTQSDLNFVDDEGDVFPLRTYGMFSLDFTDEQGTETLNAEDVKVHLDTAQVRMPEHIQEMKLWSLNPETGLWEEEGDFNLEKSRRRRREERTFLVGNMEIKERRLFNLDVPESRRCYVKVRAYRSERFLPSEQIQGVVISVINTEPEPGFSSNPRAWGRFDSVVTGPNGACVPAFCDEQNPEAYAAYILASLGGEELEAVPSAPKLNPNAIGVPQPYLNKLNYRRTDHEDPNTKKTAFRINMAKPSPNSADENNGPIYAYENLKECEEAPYSAAHFRFYRIEGDRYDYNTVPFSEDDLMSWTDDYLAWWPKPMEFRACYIKVKINGPQEVNIRSRNMGGTHPRTIGRLYGIRDVRSIRDPEQQDVSAACLEFKCSGMLFDQDRVDRTLVKVIPQGSCRRESVNSMLHEYLVNHLPMATNNDSSEYTMLAPLDPLGHNYGIYTVTDQDPRIAKEIALGRCFDGTSDGTSRIMKSDIGVALTFTCSERSAAEQSLFESQRNLGQQSVQVPPRESPAYQRPVGSRQITQSRIQMRGQRPSSY